MRTGLAPSISSRSQRYSTPAAQDNALPHPSEVNSYQGHNTHDTGVLHLLSAFVRNLANLPCLMCAVFEYVFIDSGRQTSSPSVEPGTRIVRVLRIYL
jgi:hypothetical protein